MATLIRSRRLEDLATLLERLETLHDRLHQAIRRKIEAMRRNDLGAMGDATQEEARLAGQIREREGLRKQLLEALGREAGWPMSGARVLPASELLSRLAEPQRSALAGRVERLRASVARVAQANRLAGAVARGTLDHLGWVFAAVRHEDGKAAGYSDRGGAVVAAGTRILDAVG